MKGDEPDAVVDFLDTDGLAREALGEIDLLTIETEPSAVRHQHRSVMERIAGFRKAGVGPGRGRIDLRRALHGQSLMRTLGIELFEEGVELALLLQQICSGGPGGFLFQGPVHALMPAVLLRMAGPNALDTNP